MSEDKIIVTHEDTKEEAKANFIELLPSENWRDGKEPVYMPDSISFYKWLREKHPQVGISIKEGVKHADLRDATFWLPLLVIEYGILPMTVNLISSYLYERLRGNKNSDQAIVHMEVHVVDNKKKTVTKIKYDGPRNGIEKIIESAKK